MDPAKIFRFGLEFSGFVQLTVQEIDEPEVEITAVKHGAGNHDEKTAGGIATSDATLRKLVASELAEQDVLNWLYQAQSPLTGTGGAPAQYKKDLVLKEYGPNGTVIRAEVWEGAWVRKRSKNTKKLGDQSENVIEEATVSVDRVRPL